MLSQNKVQPPKPLERAVCARKWPGSTEGRPGRTEGLGRVGNLGRHPRGGTLGTNEQKLAAR